MRVHSIATILGQNDGSTNERPAKFINGCSHASLPRLTLEQDALEVPRLVNLFIAMGGTQDNVRIAS